MIGYVTLGTNDLARAASFYDPLFASLGMKRVFDTPRGIFWGAGMTSPMLGVMTPFDGQPANVGNGTMVALNLSSRAAVDALHQLALSLGGRDEGAPGERMPGFYAGYFRDLDGNKLDCFFMG